MIKINGNPLFSKKNLVVAAVVGGAVATYLVAKGKLKGLLREQVELELVLELNKVFVRSDGKKIPAAVVGGKPRYEWSGEEFEDLMASVMKKDADVTIKIVTVPDYEYVAFVTESIIYDAAEQKDSRAKVTVETIMLDPAL